MKILGTSPANGLVVALQQQTLPFLPTEGFILFLGGLEMCIGLLIIMPRWERFTILLLCVHMATTFLPFVFLPGYVWQGTLTPTLEGQYIIKNLVIIALAIGIATHLAPMRKR